jgi:hypothetical protein
MTFTGSIDTYASWQAFAVQSAAIKPPVVRLTRPEYEALDATQRRRLDLVRSVAVANIPKVETPMAVQAAKTIERTLRANTFNTDPGVRTGLFLSAPSSYGKSTLMRELAARFEADVREVNDYHPLRPDYADVWVPVAWVPLSASPTITALCRRILEFFGEGHSTARATEALLTQRVLGVLRDCGTKLLVLDDITRLKMHREADVNVADFVRELQESSCTIMGLGVDVEGSGILNEGETSWHEKRLLTQTRRRFVNVTLDRFYYDTDEHIDAFTDHVTQMLRSVPLLDQPDTVHPSLVSALYARTQGVIGPLATLITHAAIDALLTDDERITVESVQRIQLDVASEQDQGTVLRPVARTVRVRPQAQRKNRNRVFDGANPGTLTEVVA